MEPKTNINDILKDHLEYKFRGILYSQDELPTNPNNGDMYVILSYTKDDNGNFINRHEDSYVATVNNDEVTWTHINHEDFVLDNEGEPKESVPAIADVMVGDDGRMIQNDLDTLSSIKESENSGEELAEDMTKDEEDILDHIPTTENISKELKEVYDMSEQEILQMMMVIERLRNNETFSVYNNLPEKMQNLVKAGMASNGITPTMENRNITARALLEDILHDVKNDEEFIELSKALKEITQIPSLIDFHSENYKEVMEEKLVEVAEQCKEEKPEISKSLLAISDAWKDTYTFTRIYKNLDDKESYRNSVTKDIDHWYPKRVRDFTFKAEKSKYIINDMNIMLRALNKYFGNKYPEYIYKAFICQFYYTTMDLDFNKPDEIAYVYYTIKNVISLEFVNKEKMLDFNQELVANLTRLLDYIVELDKAYQERIKNRKGKNKHARK